MARVTVSPTPSGSPPADRQRGLILTVAKGTGIAMVVRVLSKVSWLISHALLARVLGKYEYGLFTLGWTIFQIGSMGGSLGLPQGVMRFGAPLWKVDHDGFRRVVQQSLFLGLLSGTLWGSVFFLAAPYFVSAFHTPDLLPVLRAAAIAMSAAAVLRVLAGTIQISRRVGLSNFLQDLLPGLLLGGLVWLLTVQTAHGLIGALVAWALAYLLSLIVAFLWLGRLYAHVYRPVSWRRSFFHAILLFAVPVFFSLLLTNLLEWSTRLILGYLRPPAEVGLYQAAAQVASLPSILLFSISSIFAPLIAHLAGQVGMLEHINELYKITTKWSFYLSLPFVLVILFFPRATLTLLFGSGYAEGFSVLLVLVAGQIIHAGTGTVTAMHTMLGYEKRLVFNMGMGLLLALGLNVLLIPPLGATGAALGSALGLTLSNFLGITNLRRRAGLWPYDRRYWKGIMAGLAASLVLLLLTRHSLSLFLQLGLAAVSSTLVFFLVLWWLRFDEEDIIFLNAVHQRVLKWLGHS